MVNLRSIQSSITFTYETPIPSFEHLKIRSLLNLQHGPNGLRNLQIKVFLHSVEGIEALPTFRPRYPSRYPPFGDFNMALQEKLRKGAEPRLLER